MKKILHFLPDNLAWGGIETYLHHTLPLVRQRRHYEVIAAVSTGGKLAQKLREAGVKVRELPLHLHTPILRTLDFRVLFSLLAILQEEKPDLVHIHKGRVEQAIIKLAGFPLVYTYHGYGGPNNLETAPNHFLRNVYAATRPLLRSLTPFLSGMIIVSDYERKRLYREGYLAKPFEAQVIHNGLPIEAMREQANDSERGKIRQELGLSIQASPTSRLLLFACRLSPDKNADAFLRIAKRVLSHPNLKRPAYFVAAGNGAYAELFEREFAHDPLLLANGCYLGFRPDVQRLLNACDFTISTSLQEGFGLRVLESMALGKPTLTYAAGGIPEVMDFVEAKDWLVPLGDENAFVEQLVQAVNLPDDALAALSPILRAEAERFDIEKHVNQLELFYQQTLSHHPHQATAPSGSGHSTQQLT
ncbi:MAG: glycosyltransferase family 4 protein [Vampirovibrionales bacterium]|nr:glycosyltransferase family 4 protein [Vampirovibrionales bacterium]